VSGGSAGAPGVPEVLRLGPARLTAGLDRHLRLDAEAHRSAHGPLPYYGREALLDLAQKIDLRGRGGAGFPFARKARSTLEAAGRLGSPIAIVVNGTEGEPACAKDRMLLARAPHLILDGAAMAADAFGAAEIIIGVAMGGPGETSMPQAVAERASTLPCPVQVVALPERFVAGESSALIRGVTGRTAVPSTRKLRASEGGEGGVRGLPTLLSNAETYSQLAIAARLGPDAYAVVGTPAEPGTVLLTVSRARKPPLVVEVPAGARLGVVLDACEITAGQGVLIGGYHGAWLPPAGAEDIQLCRAGVSVAGGTFGAGAVATLPDDTCPIGEVARVAAWLAGQSAGQCGPCRLGLPDTAAALADLANGEGGARALEEARRIVGSTRGRGACAHPDGSARFVLTALDVFTDDIRQHMRRGGCGRRTVGVLPLPGDRTSAVPAPEEEGPTLVVDWKRCDAHGLCASLAPELISLGDHGYPIIAEGSVPPWLAHSARRAVNQCPALALRLAR
jgi:NADH:ubiquinone oxidoreductase subunit F (NADH-binding)/ferredoxin